MESIETINGNDFFEFYNSRAYTANCFNDDGSLNKNYNSFKTTGVIASIFEDHWDTTYSNNKDIIDCCRPNASQLRKYFFFPFEHKINLLFKAV